MDIKELAPTLAHRTCNRYKHGDEWPYQFTEQGVIDFATSLIAPTARGVNPVNAIDYDEEIDRYYIPVHPNWEVQTKGKGSSFRIARRDCHGERWIVMDKHLHQMLEDMARDINARFTAPPLPAIPDGCVVVQRKVTEEGKCVLATPGNYRTYQDQWAALIAAGEVKP